MLAQTMSHWYRFHAVQLSRRWNPTSTIRCRIDHFTLPNVSNAIFISLRYSDRRRIDIDLMQFCDLGEILWQVLWYEYIMGLANWMLPCKILIFSYFDVCHEFPISMEELNCKPIIIFGQMLCILSIRLIEREIDMHDAELYNSREKTHWTVEYCIIKFGWNIDLQPKISTQLKRSDCEK